MSPQPPGPYADLGPPIDPEQHDRPPLRIVRISELSERNGLGETVFLVTAIGPHSKEEMQLIVTINPRTGAITRSAINLRQGGGFITADPELLPGNLADILKSIATDPRPAP